MKDLSLLAPGSLVLQKLIAALTSMTEGICDVLGLQIALLLIVLSVALQLE